MRIILALILLVCAVDAFAAEPTLDESPEISKTDSLKKKPVKKKIPDRSRGILSGGIGGVGEKANDNRNYEARTLLFTRIGLGHGQHEFLLEVGGFKQQTGESGLTVSRFHQQIDIWYHYMFFPRAPVGHPYLGFALGAQRDEVSTSFFGSTAKAVGAFEAQLSVGAGYRFELGEILTLWFEGRLATSNNYSPSVLPSAVTAIGFRL